MNTFHLPTLLPGLLLAFLWIPGCGSDRPLPRSPLPSDTAPVPRTPIRIQEAESGTRSDTQVRRISLTLIMEGNRCVCSVDGDRIGFLPAAASAVLERIEALSDEPRVAEGVLDIHPRVPHTYVTGLVNACTRAGITRLKFARSSLRKPSRSR